MKKIPYKVRMVISTLCFVTTLLGLFAVGYLYNVSAPIGAIVGSFIVVVVCIIAGIVFMPTNKPDGTPIVYQKKSKPRARTIRYKKPAIIKRDDSLSEEDEEEEEEDEIIAMEISDD